MAKEIIHPVGGLNRQFGFQKQPPYTTPWASNVRSRGALTGRARGGSRPGLVRAYTGHLGSDNVAGTLSTAVHAGGYTTITASSAVFAPWMVGMFYVDDSSSNSYPIYSYTSPTVVVVTGNASGESGAFSITHGDFVNMMASVRPADGATGATYLDDFEGVTSGYQIYPDWTAMAHANTLPYVYETGGRRYARAVSTPVAGYETASAALKALSLDSSKPYTLSMVISPVGGTFPIGYYQLHAKMNDSTPAALTDGVTAEVLFNAAGRTCACTVTKHVGSTATALISNSYEIPGYYPFTFSMYVNGTSVTMYVDGVSRGTTSSAPAGVGKRVGFTLGHPTASTYPLIDEFRVDYSLTSQDLDFTKAYLCAGAGGSFYAENDAGNLTVVSGNVNLVDDRLVDAVELNGKLWIADYDTPRLETSACTIDADGTGGAAGTGKVVDKAGITWDSATYGISVDNDLCVITSSTGSPTAVEAGAYKITSVSSTIMTLSDVADSEDSALEIKVERAPKVYDPGTGALAIWSQTIAAGIPSGIMPTGCPLIARYRGRIVLGGANSAPHVWYMSRIGDPQDWDYGADPDDVARAIPGTSTDYGVIAKPLTALVSYSDDYLLFGCKNELWVLRGDPGDDGFIDNISYEVGIIGQRAWCHTPGGELAFMATDGLYVLAGGAQGKPVDLSRDTLPRELINIDTSANHVLLAWDGQEYGIHIFVTPKTQGKAVRSTAAHYFFDWSFKAFWPVVLWGAHEPTSVLAHEVDGERYTLLGCRDGRVRRFSLDAGADDGASLQSGILVGPFRGDPEWDALFSELTGLLATSSASVSWAIYGGDSAESAYDAFIAGTSLASGTWTAGRNRIVRPRRRGNSFYLYLYSNGTNAWEWDSAVVAFKAVGKTR